jgi:hypothetical protein
MCSPFMKRFLKWAALVVGSLLLLTTLAVGSFLGWLRWSGDHDWKLAEAELRAKGEKLTFEELVPPMPRENENFFADPLWAGYTDLVRTNRRGCDGVEREVLDLRIPSDQQPIRRWQKVPLSSQEADAVMRITGKAGSKRTSDRVAAYGDLRGRLRYEKNAERKKELAALTLQILSPADEMLARITELSKRPRAQFPLRYDLINREGFIPNQFSQQTEILHLSQMLMLRATSELLLGKNAEAAADAETLLRLSFIQQNEPLLMALLVRVSTTSVALQVLDQGLAGHTWTAGQLTLYQSLLGKIDLPENLLFVLRGERAYFRAALSAQKPFRSIAQGLLNKDAAYHALLMQAALERMEDARKTTGWNISTTHFFKEEHDALEHRPFHRILYLLVTLANTAIETAFEKTAECQTQADQSMLACALERYRLAYGAYPPELDALVPDYLVKIPNSPIAGRPMNYLLKPDGSFLLWTPGWNMQSLGGKTGMFKGDGDVVWNQAIPEKNKDEVPARKSSE